MNRTIPAFDESPAGRDMLSPQFGGGAGQADTLRSAVAKRTTNELNESTLRKESRLEDSCSKEDLGGKKVAIDPKDMTNDELNEYVSHGKLPDRLLRAQWTKYPTISSPSSIVSPAELANFFTEAKQNQTALQISNISNGLLSPPIRRIATTEGSLVSEANDLGFLVKNSSSQAASGAIKSLQERVKALERENAMLKEEQQRQPTRDDWKDQLERRLEELAQIKQAELDQKLEVMQVQRESIAHELREASAQLQLRDKQMALLECEKDKHLEENSLVTHSLRQERERWAQERAKIMRQVSILQEKLGNAEIVAKEQGLQLQRSRVELASSEGRVKQLVREQNMQLKARNEKIANLNKQLQSATETRSSNEKRLEAKIRRLEMRLKQGAEKLEKQRQEKRERVRSHSAKKQRRAVHNTSVDSTRRPSSARAQRTPGSCKTRKYKARAGEPPLQILNANVFDSQVNSEAGHQDYMLISEGYRPAQSRLKESDLEDEKESGTQDLQE